MPPPNQSLMKSSQPMTLTAVDGRQVMVWLYCTDGETEAQVMRLPQGGAMRKRHPSPTPTLQPRTQGRSPISRVGPLRKFLFLFLFF